MNTGKERDWMENAIVLMALTWIGLSFFYTVQQGKTIAGHADNARDAMVLRGSALPPVSSAGNIETADTAIHVQSVGLNSEQSEYYRLMYSHSRPASRTSKSPWTTNWHFSCPCGKFPQGRDSSSFMSIPQKSLLRGKIAEQENI